MVPRVVSTAVLCAAAACGGTTTSNSTNGGGPSGSAANPVAIVDFSYAPASLTVSVNAAVEWENSGAVAHTVTSDNGAFDSGQLAGATPGGPYGGGSSGAKYTRTFGTAGTFPYHCVNHPFMTGTVSVTP